MPPKHPQLNSFISPDGSIEIRVLKSGENQIIERQSSKLEILGNGKQICPLISMRAPITDLTFSPDGKLFVIGSHNYVELRDTSAPLRVYWSSQFQYMRVDRLLFSSNSKQIVAMKEAESGGLTVGETAIWQANRKKEKGSPEEEKKRQEEDKRRQEERERRQEEYVVIYDTQTGKQICEFMIGRYSDWYYSFRRNIVISPVYLLLTSGDKKGTINFWDTSPGWKLSRRVGTLESAYAFGVSDDGRFLATISETDDIQDLAIIYIRDLPSRKILRTIRLSLGIPQMIADAIHLGYSEKAKIEDGEAAFSSDNSVLALGISVSFPGIGIHDDGNVEFVLGHSAVFRKTYLVSLTTDQIQEVVIKETEFDSIANPLQGLFKKQT